MEFGVASGPCALSRFKGLGLTLSQRGLSQTRSLGTQGLRFSGLRFGGGGAIFNRIEILEGQLGFLLHPSLARASKSNQPEIPV